MLLHRTYPSSIAGVWGARPCVVLQVWVISSSVEICLCFPSELLSQFPTAPVPAEGGMGLLGGYYHPRGNVRGYKNPFLVEELAAGRMQRDQHLS